MASRQEEKEARRKARLEQEAKEARAAARNKRLQMVLGGVLAVLIVVGAVIGITASGGGDGGDDGAPQQATTTDATLPAPETADLQQAVDAAGCTFEQVENEGNLHEQRTFTAADYEQNPPTSGTHTPNWADDGTFTQENLPQLGMLVHTLEHGRINVQYQPGASPELVEQLQAFVNENDGYHMLLYPNPTEMDAQVAATAWDHTLTCSEVNDSTWDALRTFRDDRLDKGPEKVP